MRLKTCSLCKTQKSIDNYWHNSKAKDGLYAHCKSCHTLQSRKTREKYREKYREKARVSAYKWREKYPEINKAMSRKYYALNKETYKERDRIRRLKIRQDVLKKYGNKCNCCGEKEYTFLAIDHVGNDGNKHRKELKYKDITVWAYRNGYPNNLQILCHNCNHGKYLNGGICPHKLLK
jgi:hypothetical protein